MLADNLHNVKETIASALARRTERKETGDEVCLVAVTKNHPAAVVTEIQSLGVGNIGENRVQEAREKQQQIGHPGKWHLIGHLQTNKAKQSICCGRWKRKQRSRAKSWMCCCRSMWLGNRKRPVFCRKTMRLYCRCWIRFPISG